MVPGREFQAPWPVLPVVEAAQLVRPEQAVAVRVGHQDRRPVRIETVEVRRRGPYPPPRHDRRDILVGEVVVQHLSQLRTRPPGQLGRRLQQERSLRATGTVAVQRLYK